MMPLLNAAPPWPARSDHVVLWHGCTADDASKIGSGVDPTVGRLAVDFGRGFYTTTLERQARQWAWDRYYDLRARRLTRAGNVPVVIRFTVKRFELAKLSSLQFVGESFHNEDFWSFVQHCRTSVDPNARKGIVGVVEHHFGPINFDDGLWYDVVCGPVAAFWQQRSSMADADQISFHTPDAVAVLNDCISRGGHDFQILAVT